MEIYDSDRVAPVGGGADAPLNGRRTSEAHAAASDLRRENERLRRLVTLQGDLVASVAHDLRTPLTSVLGFTELLLKQELEPAARERYLRIINGEAQRFSSLVDDLFDAQLIAQGRSVLSLTLFDLGELLREQVELFRAHSEAHELRLVPPQGPTIVLADAGRIARVVANLVSNAIKYSPEGGDVTVALETHDGVARVSVTDTGIGIRPEQQHLVFAKFFRAESSNPGIKGVGLGLALCREIIHAHAGTLGFDSTYGEGSTFWFELRDRFAPDTE